MSGSGRTKISRSKFIGLGASALLLSSAPALVNPFVAKAKTVSFMAATSAKLTDWPYNCRGDGSDEGDKIQKCFDENLYVEVPEPPAGLGYGIGPRNTQGITMRSGLEVSGVGAASKFLRVGPYKQYQKCFLNSDHDLGNSGIKMHGISIWGFRDKPDVPHPDSECQATAISFYTNYPDQHCTNIELTDVEIHDWPGISVKVTNGSGFRFTDVKSANPSRGGIIFARNSNDVYLLRVASVLSGDDSFGIHAIESLNDPNRGPIRQFTLDQCEASTRSNAQYGSGAKIRGAREVLVTFSTFRKTVGSGVQIASVGGFNPYDIKVMDSKMLQSQRNSYFLEANEAQLIEAQRNYMYQPEWYCINVGSMKGDARTFDATLTENTLVRPHSGKHIYVQDNLSGVYTDGNELIYADNENPVISDVFPKPNTSVAYDTPTVRATITDDSILFKSDLALYFNGREIPRSDYSYSSWTKKELRYPTPKLSPGKKSVKLIATDKAGHSATKTWSFTAT